MKLQNDVEWKLHNYLPFFSKSLQASILKKYPAVLVIIFYMMLYYTILSIVFTLIVVRDAGAWRLGLDLGLVSVLYTVSSWQTLSFRLIPGLKIFNEV